MAHPTLSTRPSAALTLLRDTAGRPPPRPERWSWVVMTLDSKGRVGLPPVARRALGAATGGVAVRAAARGAVLVLRADGDGNGAGAPLVVDGRGRVPLPVWWRRACVGGACAVATRTGVGAGETALVVVAPTGCWTGWRTCWWGAATTDRALRARVLLAEAAALGVMIDDLVAAAGEGPPVPARVGPTVAGYVDVVAPTFSPGTAATYRSYWRLAIARLGDRPVSEVGVEDCRAVVADAVARARRRRPGCDGRASEEACVTALRALFGRAELGGFVVRSPAAGLVKPRRRASRRRPLDDSETRELVDAVRATSRDPDLDLLVVRFHLESGARREGALGLRLRDLDRRRSTAWLRERFSAEREQPLAPSLLDALVDHATGRGATGGEDHVFRTAAGRPISRRHYNTLFDRARTALVWAARTPVSAHALRHTAITAVARVAGYPVAQAFAGHAPPSVTGSYMRVGVGEVAAALAVLTDEPHPLCPPELAATSTRRPRCDRAGGR